MKKGDGPLFHSVPIHIGDLKSEINDKDVQFLLDDLLGIINLYEEKNIDCTIFDTGFSKQKISTRISEILDIAEIIEISKLRYKLGLREHILKVIPEIRMRVRSLVTKKEYASCLRASQEILSVVLGPQDLPPKIGELTNFFTHKYNPPIIDLETRIYESMYGNFDSEDPSPYFPLSIYTEGLDTILDL
jgi:hypothetical protein